MPRATTLRLVIDTLKTFVFAAENVALSATWITLPDNFLAIQQIDRVPFVRVFLLYHTPLSSFPRIICLEFIVQRRDELLETAPLSLSTFHFSLN